MSAPDTTPSIATGTPPGIATGIAAPTFRRARRQRDRWLALAVILGGFSAATALALTALQSQVAFFYSPTELNRMAQPPLGLVRLGGLVETGSVVRGGGGRVTFRVTDTLEARRVRYQGALPDLFREGQGVVAEGRLSPDGWLEASRVLARHDERYQPPEAKNALEAADRVRAETSLRED